MRMRVLLLAAGPRTAAGIDLDSGALRRLHWRATPEGPLARYDVVEATGATDDQLVFPLDSVVALDPKVVGHLSGRKADAYLRRLVLPESRTLLGSPGPTVAYWTLRADQPTLTLVEPSAGPVVERDRSLRFRCRFRWRRLDHDLPLTDLAVEQTLAHPSADRLVGGTLARALGWRPHRLLVSLAPPRDGQCPKVVTALLPKP
ncbi:MAG TPA: hypothetical protein VHN98_05465 [Acidimicrobiales bacterium]|nr:hypothetical protein [Acidimicrobiales bacterium]